jgi:hypothetical protein
MTTTLVRLFAAAVFAIAAWLSWSESRTAAGVANARQSIATFDYTAVDGLTPGAAPTDYLPGERRRLADDIRLSKASVAYWLGRYDTVAADTGGGVDAGILLAAANAAYRAALRDLGYGPAAVQKLDGVLQAYASAMKAGPSPDAAYNYEYVTRVRDRVARGPQGKSTLAATVPPERMGGDLPAGPTIHGSPGGPPPEAKIEELQTIMPMEYGDREAQPEPTPGARRQRKG